MDQTKNSTCRPPLDWRYGDLIYKLPGNHADENGISANDALSIPVSYPRTFDEVRCHSIIARARRMPPSRSDVTFAPPGARKAQGYWLHPDDEWRWLYDATAKIFATANQRFGFRVAGFVDPILIAEYPQGPGFDWHLDAVTGPTSSRKLSITIPLCNREDFKGGELEIAPFGVDAVWQQRGTATVFPSFLCHRVTPITKGSRWALVAWLHGPSFT